VSGPYEERVDVYLVGEQDGYADLPGSAVYITVGTAVNIDLSPTEKLTVPWHQVARIVRRRLPPTT